MNIPEILQLACCGGLASAGFGVLFNCPPRLLGHCFGAGVLAIATRSLVLDGGFSLPVASFVAALILGIANRLLERDHGLASAFLAVVGCIPMIPGSLAAKGLQNLFNLFDAAPAESAAFAVAGVGNLTIVAATLAGIGTALVLPNLIYPPRREAHLSTTAKTGTR